jgi:RHS repeat-associated protein
MPIDIASGAVHLEAKEASLGGRFPLVWARKFHTALIGETNSPFGPGWTGSYFAQLTRKGKDYHFRSPEGMVIAFPDPKNRVDRFEVVRDLGSFHEITRLGSSLTVTQWPLNGKCTRYRFVPGSDGNSWRLHSVENPSGEGVEFSWDEQGRLKGLRQKREKRTLLMAYAAAGRISSVSFRHPDGRLSPISRYEYDASGRLSAVYNALGQACRYEYDAEGRLHRELARDGGVFTYKYDDRGRCVRYSGLDGYDLKTLRYLDAVGWTEVTDSLGRVNRYELSPGGQIIRHIDPMGGSTLTEFDEHGRMISKTDPTGGKTGYSFDDFGNLATITNPLGEKAAYEYNAVHLMTCKIDAAGHRWERTYDSSNRLVEESGPLGMRCAISYDPDGNPVEVKAPESRSLRRKFSEKGEIVETLDWSGQATRFIRDDFGRVIKRRNPDGVEMHFHYDPLGRLIGASDSTGRSQSFEYDVGGNRIAKRASHQPAVHYLYGTCHRLLETKTVGAGSIRYRWGSEPGQLLEVLNERNEKYAFEYDRCDRVSKETGFDGSIQSFAFDAAGRCIGKTNAMGQSIRWKLDALGRVVEEILGGQESTRYQYDALGNIIMAENPWTKVEFERDESGRILVERQGGFEIRREYGSWDELVRVESDAGADIRYGYDPNGRIATVDAGGLGAYAYSRSTGDQVDGIELPGGFRWKQAYDSRGRLLSQQLIGSSVSEEALPRRAYSYDERDLLISIDDAQWGPTHFAHDGENRLVGFRTETARADFTLDAAGDPLSVTEPGGGKAEFGYGSGGALLRRGRDEYAYDGAGRVIERKIPDRGPRSQSLSWDALDRLRSIVTSEGVLWEYAYDPFGRRISKKSADREIRFYWNGNVLLHEIESGAALITWGFEPSKFKPIFKIQAGRLSSILCDHLGTPHEMLGSDGRVHWKLQTDPWGKPLQGKGELTDCPFRLPGQYFDAESGLHYNLFRYFDPRPGRFLSQDPIRLHGGTSLYQYVKNPLHWIDPYGLCPEEEEPKPESEEGTEQPADKKTPIYRLGSGTNTNLTPREKDTTGLSYTLIKPESGKYTETSIEAVNGTGVLQAVNDHGDHVSITPTDPSKMQPWIDSRPTAETDPHPLTTTLKGISEKKSG